MLDIMLIFVLIHTLLVCKTELDSTIDNIMRTKINLKYDHY